MAFTPARLYRDEHFDGRIFQEVEGDWALQISREGFQMDDLRGFPTFDAAHSQLIRRHPQMTEVQL